MANDNFAVELLEDFLKTKDHWTGPDAQFWRRAGVRALFGSLEAWCSSIRAGAPDLICQRKAAGLLLADEEDRARELLRATDRFDVTLDDRGLPKKQKRKVSFRPLLRAVIRLNCLAWGMPSNYADANFGRDGWHKLADAIKVRDRLMHPAAADDIVVADADLDRVAAAWDWFRELFDHIDQGVKKAMAELKRKLPDGGGDMAT